MPTTPEGARSIIAEFETLTQLKGLPRCEWEMVKDGQGLVVSVIKHKPDGDEVVMSIEEALELLGRSRS